MVASDIGAIGDMCDKAICGLSEDDREDNKKQEEVIRRGN